MADVIEPAIRSVAPARNGTAAAEASSPPHYDIIELLFFAYRDFVRDADELLARYGFGRAHHRVLHFVNRHPGMRVTELLDVLKITKQSLGRVLRELIDTGFVIQNEGPLDRRQRLLYTTVRGAALAGELADLQSRRIDAALESCGPGAHAAAAAFLMAMVDEDEREAVGRIVARPAVAAREPSA